jgi:hypothetical protein
MPIMQRLSKIFEITATTLRDRLESIEACVGMADTMAQRFLDGGKLSELGLKTLTAAARTTTRRKR